MTTPSQQIAPASNAESEPEQHKDDASFAKRFAVIRRDADERQYLFGPAGEPREAK